MPIITTKLRTELAYSWKKSITKATAIIDTITKKQNKHHQETTWICVWQSYTVSQIGLTEASEAVVGGAIRIEEKFIENQEWSEQSIENNSELGRILDQN